jgi:sigma-B regulation protein RsbU (phosphoserine phosphatase)
VLGHDLRNPLAAIGAGARLLARKNLDHASTSLVEQMLRSIDRMSELIDNVLDFARGRLGGGFPIERSVDKPLRPTLEHVIAEMRAAYPNRKIETNFDQAEVTGCDLPRIGQLLSNLVSNAFKHGAPEAPVKVATRVSEGVFVLTVVNKGEPISSVTMENLFKPFFRAPERAGQKNLGLGLGLYIASEIARSHGGKLDASSNDEETCFTFTLPLSR